MIASCVCLGSFTYSMYQVMEPRVQRRVSFQLQFWIMVNCTVTNVLSHYTLKNVTINTPLISVSAPKNDLLLKMYVVLYFTLGQVPSQGPVLLTLTIYWVCQVWLTSWSHSTKQAQTLLYNSFLRWAQFSKNETLCLRQGQHPYRLHWNHECQVVITKSIVATLG